MSATEVVRPETKAMGSVATRHFSWRSILGRFGSFIAENRKRRERDDSGRYYRKKKDPTDDYTHRAGERNHDERTQAGCGAR